MVVDTTLPGSPSNQMDLPMIAAVEVDWGDGNVDNTNSHVYTVSGQYTITITDPATVTGFRFANGGDKDKLIDVTSCNNLTVDNNAMFQGCSNLTWTATNAPIIAATDIGNMFSSNSSFNGNLDSWDTSSVQSFAACFSDSDSLDHYMAWDLSSATNTSFMYSESNGLLHTAGQITYTFAPAGNVNAQSMFRANSLVVDPPTLVNSSSITNYSAMYSFTAVDTFQNHDYSNATNVAGCYQQADVTGNITSFNVPLTTSLGDCFSSCDVNSLTGVVTGTALTNTSFMLPNNSNLTNLGLFDTQNVTTARAMLQNCSSLTSLPAFDWSSCDNFTNFLTGVTINTTDYDALLVEIDANGLLNGTLDGGNSTYTSAGAGGTARTSLLGKGWSIVDGGGV
jgi:surface protein